MTRLPAAVIATILAGSAAPADSGRGRPTDLPTATVRDLEAADRMFDRGIPITVESFSPDGFHFVYLHHVPGGFLRRKPERCAFLIDLDEGTNEPIKTPKGPATRLGGWDPTGRYLLVETSEPDFLSSITGNWTTYHWIFDVVTGQYVPRKPFTGRRDGERFLWKRRNVYHGVWNDEEDAKVWPLEEGELARIYNERARELQHEDNRRLELAERLAVGDDDGPTREFAAVLPRLDARWTRRGQRDPVISELFGQRPALYSGIEGDWTRILEEVEFVAVLDRGIALVTGRGGRQWLFHVERWELLPLPEVPEGYTALLDARWDRKGGFYDELDPLPRDLQYRRSWDESRGLGYYFHYVSPDLRRVLVLYPYQADRRVLRIVDLPSTWRRRAPSPAES